MAHFAGKRVVETVEAKAEIALVHRDEIQADARLEAQGPVIFRDAGQDMVGGQLPGGGNDAVFDPQGVIVFAAHLGADEGVLGDLIGLPPGASQADAGRVEHQILQGGNGFNHLGAGPEMIKLRLGQGRDGAGEGVDGVIAHGGGFSQGQAEVGVKLVGGGSAAVELRLGRVPAAAFHQHAKGAGAQEPHSGVHQAKIIFRQLPDFGGGWLLEEEGQFGGMAARGAENAEVAGAFRGEPHAQAEHVHLGKGRQLAREPQEDVAAGDHGGDTGRGVGQDALVIGQLQVEQRLVQALAARPADDGNGHEQFAGERIGGQAPALAAGMKNELAAGVQPVVEGLRGVGLTPGPGQQVGRAAAGAKRLAGGIAGGKPFGPPASLQLLELRSHARRQGQEILNGNGVLVRGHCLAGMLGKGRGGVEGFRRNDK